MNLCLHAIILRRPSRLLLKDPAEIARVGVTAIESDGGDAIAGAA